MPELKRISFGYGKIEFNKGVEGEPATSETSGNVTVHNSERQAVSPHYEADFSVTAFFEESGISFSNYLHWSTIVMDGDKLASYGTVESKAAAEIAPMLRALAQEIEEQYGKSEAT